MEEDYNSFHFIVFSLEYISLASPYISKGKNIFDFFPQCGFVNDQELQPI